MDVMDLLPTHFEGGGGGKGRECGCVGLFLYTLN